MEMKVVGGGGGEGEVRRIHIIYFLSRMGRVEQPHLIRIQHIAPNGVYLRGAQYLFKSKMLEEYSGFSFLMFDFFCYRCEAMAIRFEREGTCGVLCLVL